MPGKKKRHPVRIRVAEGIVDHAVEALEEGIEALEDDDPLKTMARAVMDALDAAEDIDPGSIPPGIESGKCVPARLVYEAIAVAERLAARVPAESESPGLVGFLVGARNALNAALQVFQRC